MPDYPARLDVDYPAAAVARAGPGQVVAARAAALPDRRGVRRRRVAVFNEANDDWAWTSGGGLIGCLVLIAGVVLLFTGRYPRGIFDFVWA